MNQDEINLMKKNIRTLQAAMVYLINAIKNSDLFADDVTLQKDFYDMISDSVRESVEGDQ